MSSLLARFSGVSARLPLLISEIGGALCWHPPSVRVRVGTTC